MVRLQNETAYACCPYRTRRVREMLVARTGHKFKGALLALLSLAIVGIGEWLHVGNVQDRSRWFRSVRMCQVQVDRLFQVLGRSGGVLCFKSSRGMTVGFS